MGFWKDATEEKVFFLLATNSDLAQLGNIGEAATNHIAYFEIYSFTDCAAGTISMKERDDAAVTAVNLPSTATAYTTTSFYYMMFGRICG
jgi:hypothetical protein